MSLRWDHESIEATRIDANGQSLTQSLTHGELAQLSNYEAHSWNLPQTVEATLVVSVEGRIDGPEFRITTLLEPFHLLQPWVVYRREGALLFVGERMFRLTFQQLRVWDAIDRIHQAGADIPARLAAWPSFTEALHMPGKGQVLLGSELPQVKLTRTAQLPHHGLTREGKGLMRAQTESHWAMEAGHRYYLREA